ncbi:hypothetical protein AC622_03165 [Bacillus sp. FJAT-27916]|nr:hypothetical protein AC622_03165 [Bacillus sp. FJAT-27916]
MVTQRLISHWVKIQCLFLWLILKPYQTSSLFYMKVMEDLYNNTTLLDTDDLSFGPFLTPNFEAFQIEINRLSGRCAVYQYRVRGSPSSHSKFSKQMS